MNQPPTTYAEWVKYFDRLKETNENEEQILAVMYQGKIDWVPGVAERFIRQVKSVVDKRFDDSTKKLRRDLSYAKGQEHLLVPALIAERKRSEFVVRFVQLPAIPDEMKRKFLQAIDDAIQKLQDSLETSARNNDPTGKLYNIVRNNPVTVPIPTIEVEEKKNSKSKTNFFTQWIQNRKRKTSDR
jgi:hypothetical protein